VIDASVLVVGGGAIGGVTAGLMTGNVRRVAVLDANREHVGLLRSPGLRLDELGAERLVPLEAYRSVAELDGRFDFGLITLKAQNLELALPEIVERDLVDVFAGLGNGLVQDRVAALVGGERLVAGIVEWGATNVAPGHLSQTTRNVFVVGELDGPVRERTERLARVLETVAHGGPLEGRTELYVLPGFAFRRVDALLTNFHLPRSTLLMLVSAFAGREAALAAYQHAVAARYRFFSYGDCMLIT